MTSWRNDPAKYEAKKQQDAARRKKHPQKSKARAKRIYYEKKFKLLQPHLRKYFDSVEQLELIKSLQSNQCAICSTYAKLVIDHNHKTNEFRGLICASCNKALGFAKDSTEILGRMIWYLTGGKVVIETGSHDD